MKDVMLRLVREEEGQAMTEYGIILALIAVVVIGLLATMGTQIKQVFQSIIDKLPTVTPTT